MRFQPVLYRSEGDEAAAANLDTLQSATFKLGVKQRPSNTETYGGIGWR